MTACAKCGHDPEAQVSASWTFDIDREVHSLNGRSVNVKGWRGGVYKRDRDAWQWALKVARINQRIPIATAKRRVTLTRHYSGKQREFDRGNLIGGCKMILDAMVRESLIVDDKAEYLEDHYGQERSDHSGMSILLEELA